MGDTTDIKKGGIIRHQNDLYVITDAQFVNPGKGAAFVKTKMKSITSGKGTNITYKSGESIDNVQVQYVNLQYLYNNGTFYSFMNQVTFGTEEIEADTIGDDVKYLKEGLEVMGVMFEERVVTIQLPKKVQYRVVEAPPAVRGDSTAGNVTKDITLDNGLHVHAPIFIKEGEEILVNTETGEYSSRVNE